MARIGGNPDLKPGPGRPKGLPNKASTEFKNRLNELLESCAPDMLGWIRAAAADDPSKALDHLGRLAEYCHPKLARTELTGKDGEKLSISIVNYADEDKP